MRVPACGRDSEPPERRTAVGAVIFVGAIPAGVLALSYPVATAVGVVGITLWGVRRTIRRTESNGDGDERRPVERVRTDLHTDRSRTPRVDSNAGSDARESSEPT